MLFHTPETRTLFRSPLWEPGIHIHEPSREVSQDVQPVLHKQLETGAGTQSRHSYMGCERLKQCLTTVPNTCPEENFLKASF